MNNRKSIRFKPIPSEPAFIQIDPKGVPFEPDTAALVSNESSAGCALVVIGLVMNSNDTCQVQIGRRNPVLSQVRWCKVITPEISMIGFQYLK